MQFMSASSTFAANHETMIDLIQHEHQVEQPRGILPFLSQLPQTQAAWKNLHLVCFVWFQRKVDRSYLDAYT